MRRDAINANSTRYSLNQMKKGVENRVLQLTYGPPKATPPDNANLGTCRAAPPYSRPGGKKKWPEVDADDWCGMFKERSG